MEMETATTSPSQCHPTSPGPPGWESTIPSTQEEAPPESPPPTGVETTTVSSPPPPGWGPTKESPPPPGRETTTAKESPLKPVQECESPSQSPTMTNQLEQSNPELGQLICGVCRNLLSYPNGAIHVKCAGCRTVNHVLQAHQVGLVKCGSCFVLLMYKFGSPSVKCSCCRFVTEIGMDNKRPLFPVAQDPSSSPHIVQ